MLLLNCSPNSIRVFFSFHTFSSMLIIQLFVHRCSSTRVPLTLVFHELRKTLPSSLIWRLNDVRNLQMQDLYGASGYFSKAKAMGSKRPS
ncbi:hypothetical protein Dimus_036766 [Dionaea muscipula]